MEVAIIDLKVNRAKDNGVLYCSLVDLATGERIIIADLKYVMVAIKERGYKLVDAEDVLYKISQHILFYGS